MLFYEQQRINIIFYKNFETFKFENELFLVLVNNFSKNDKQCIFCISNHE